MGRIELSVPGQREKIALPYDEVTFEKMWKQLEREKVTSLFGPKGSHYLATPAKFENYEVVSMIRVLGELTKRDAIRELMFVYDSGPNAESDRFLAEGTVAYSGGLLYLGDYPEDHLELVRGERVELIKALTTVLADRVGGLNQKEGRDKAVVKYAIDIQISKNAHGGGGTRSYDGGLPGLGRRN